MKVFVIYELLLIGHFQESKANDLEFTVSVTYIALCQCFIMSDT